MSGWLRGRSGGFIAFILIAGLVVSGLGWATVSALRLEREQIIDRQKAKHEEKVRLALWRLDGRVAPLLAREEARAYLEYSALYAPSLALQNTGQPYQQGSVIHLSPLIRENLPDWMLLHFQVDEQLGWTSPQIPPPSVMERLKKSLSDFPFRNVTQDRLRLLVELQSTLPAVKLLATAEQKGGEPVFEDHGLGLIACGNYQFQQSANQMPIPNSSNVDQETINRFSMRGKVAQQQQLSQRDGREIVYRNILGNGLEWLTPRLQSWKLNPPITVGLTPMVPVWLMAEEGRESLLLVRLVEIEQDQLCQGIVLDEKKLEQLLLDEIHDLFPDAQLKRVKQEVPHPERTMAALPFELDTGPVQLQGIDPGWTPLRIGLLFAWIAALVAVLAVGLGGWSLIDLSERRFRFVSAVTHELRTPLTTLRLYLDMLLGGMVKGEEKQQQYLETLSGETERLHRLVTNVLAFSRLERQQPKLMKQQIEAHALLHELKLHWTPRCEEASKKLVVDNRLTVNHKLETDPELIKQILDNLIDNACKYSQEADDPSLHLRGWTESDRLIFEIEDCGPGIPDARRRAVFRAFRRGGRSDMITGGVGLGLTLAQRWAKLLGGKLTLQRHKRQSGACFRLEIPCLWQPS